MKKKLLGFVLTLALVLTLIPGVSSAGNEKYEFEADNVVGSAGIKMAASTDGELYNNAGGTVVKTGGGKYFSCSLGTWTFQAVPNPGYRFVGWETKLNWDEWKIGKGWRNYSETNPSNFHAHCHPAGRAFTNMTVADNGGAISVNHVACEAPSVATLENFVYYAVAKFERIPASLTVNHIGVSID